MVKDDSVQATDGSGNSIDNDLSNNAGSSGDAIDWQWFYPHTLNCNSPQPRCPSSDSIAKVPSPASSPPIPAGGLLDLALVTAHLQSLTEAIKIISLPTSVRFFFFFRFSIFERHAIYDILQQGSSSSPS